jgi:hypothetical protein
MWNLIVWYVYNNHERVKLVNDKIAFLDTVNIKKLGVIMRIWGI